jgi:hypothetical protein
MKEALDFKAALAKAAKSRQEIKLLVDSSF